MDEEIKASGYTNMDKVNRVREILVKGATLGCVGTGRLSSSEPNCRTVAEEGAKVVDKLHEWVKSGFVFGPFTQVCERIWRTGGRICLTLIHVTWHFQMSLSFFKRFLWSHKQI